MAFGPIISTGDKPWLEALFVVALIALLCVTGSPELSSMILQRMPWLGGFFHGLQYLLK
jgi:hypothetical protein